MPALTWYLTSAMLDSVHQELSSADPGTEVFASPVYGWIVGTTAGGNFSSADAQNEQPAASFGATAQPDGSIVTSAGTGDCWRTTRPYTGSFEAGNWEFHACIRANTTAGGTSRGRFRLFRAATVDGTSATEITAAAQVGSTVTPATGATSDSTVTTALGAISLTLEYLFVQVGWETVTAGSMTTNDVNFRVGNGSGTGTRVVSPVFDSAEGISVIPSSNPRGTTSPPARGWA